MNINTIMEKTHKKSFFKRYHQNSKLADWLYSANPHMGEGRDMHVVVLQIMPASGENYIAEIVRLKDYENEGMGRSEADGNNRMG